MTPKPGYLYVIGKLEPHPTKEGGYVGTINPSGSTGAAPLPGAMRVEILPSGDQAREHGMIVFEVRDTIETVIPYDPN